MISVVIPVVRPEKAARTVSMLYENAGIIDYEVLTEVDDKRIGCPKMVKKLVSESEGSMVCFLGDDSLPQPGFLKHALEAMRALPDGWGLVGFNDNTGRILPTHWLAHKNLLPLLDFEFFHTGYTHCCCDVELLERCRSIGRYIYAKKAVVLHDHPILKGDPIIDLDYKRVYSPEVFGMDKLLLAKRRANGWKTEK